MSARIGHVEGLRESEAAERLRADGPNVLPREPSPTFLSRFGRELREPMAALLLAAAAISGGILGEVVDAAAITVIVLANAVIALVQEGRAAHALEALEQLDTPLATVVRDGRHQVIEAEQLVVGDLTLVQAGDRVPADLDLVEAHGLEVDESVLTGESLPVTKAAGEDVDETAAIGDRRGRLHRSTLVTRGAGSGLVVATGAATAIGAIAQQIQGVKQEPTPLQRHLDALTRRLGLAAIGVASLTFAVIVLLRRGGDLEEAFLTAVALAVAAVPEGLAAVTTVALALGVGRMAARGAIVRRLPAVETLGSTDVLVIDKTGTVTENRMHPSVFIDPGGSTHASAEVPRALLRRLEPALVLCNDATSDPPTGDPTERGLLALTDPDVVESLRRRFPRLALAPFTSERKRMSSVHELESGLTLLVKGAPETVLPLCSNHTDGQDPLDERSRHDLLALAEARAGRGERLLAIARRDLDAIPDDVETAEVELTLLGVVALRDPPRPSAGSSVATARRAGVTLLMATGDHPATATAIAREIGLASCEPCTGAQIRETGFPLLPTQTQVYARVDPDQKLDLVRLLQARGHIVAMTGDGVNDAPALRQADIGVALGGTGSDVAREAADLVITDDDLATIIVAIREGRGIWHNLAKVIDYLVTSNLAEVAIVISALLLAPGFGVPLLPLQLLWINLLTDGLPALALGVDPVSPKLMDQPPRRSSDRLLDGPHLLRLGRTALVLAVGAVTTFLIAHEVVGMEVAESRTVLFSTVVLSQVLFAFVVRRREGLPPGWNPWLMASAVGAVGLHLLIVWLPAAQAVFDTTVPRAEGWLLIFLGGAVTPLLLHLWNRQGRP